MTEKIQRIKALDSQLCALLERAGYTVENYPHRIDSGHLEKGFDEYAYAFALKHRDLFPTLENLPSIAGLFTYGAWKPVPYRDIDVFIGEKGKAQISFIPDAPDEIEDDLKKTYESYLAHPEDFMAIAQFGLEFVSIHPFANYNGRTKVLLEQLLFRRAGLRGNMLLNLDEAFQKDRLHYFSALQRASGIIKGLSPMRVELYAEYLFSVMIECYQEKLGALEKELSSSFPK